MRKQDTIADSRLSDYGFPDFEESLEIYHFVNPESLILEERPLKVRGEEEIRETKFHLLSHPPK